MGSRNLLLLLTMAVAAPALAAQDTFAGPDRIVAVGDVHGDLGQFLTVLRQAGIIDGKNRWTGGRAHLVQTGDVPDRGPDTRKIIDLLMDLGRQAERAGGRVHPLIGNHEAMNVLGDLRYVVPGEYAAFRSGQSEALQARAYAALADSARRDDPAYKKDWLEKHPLGWVEHRLAYEGNGKYGTWIRGNNAVVKVGDFLFLHGGISPAYVDQPIGRINEQVRAALGEPASDRPGIAEDSLGPLWYRGLARGDETELAAHVDSVLAAFGVRHVVVGHTVTPGAVMTRFGGKVIMIDVGLSAAYGGPPAALVVDKGTPKAMHRGTLLDLPLGGDPLPYLKAAAALDPDPSRLLKFIAELEASRVAAPPGAAR